MHARGNHLCAPTGVNVDFGRVSIALIITQRPPLIKAHLSKKPFLGIYRHLRLEADLGLEEDLRLEEDLGLEEDLDLEENLPLEENLESLEGDVRLKEDL